MNIKSHTYKPGDAVVNILLGSPVDCEIVFITDKGEVVLKHKTGAAWTSNLNHIRPREENEKI